MPQGHDQAPGVRPAFRKEHPPGKKLLGRTALDHTHLPELSGSAFGNGATSRSTIDVPSGRPPQGFPVHCHISLIRSSLAGPNFTLGNQAAGEIEQVRRSDAAGDDPILNFCGGDDQDIPADVAGDKPRKGSAFPIPPAAKPTSNALEHRHVQPPLVAEHPAQPPGPPGETAHRAKA